MSGWVIRHQTWNDDISRLIQTFKLYRLQNDVLSTTDNDVDRNGSTQLSYFVNKVLIKGGHNKIRLWFDCFNWFIKTYVVCQVWKVFSSSYLCLRIAGVSLSSLCCSRESASWQTHDILGLLHLTNNYWLIKILLIVHNKNMNTELWCELIW